MMKKDPEIIVGEQLPLIEPGEYQAVCYKADYAMGLGGIKKLYLRFRIIDGKYEGIELFMACNKPTGKSPHKFKLYKQWELAIGRRLKSGERFNKKIFKNKLYLVLVRNTVRKHRNGKALPDYMQYSVIDTILEPLTGVVTDDV